jgi:hypothetical protein
MTKKRPYIILVIILLNITYPYKAFVRFKDIEKIPEGWVLLDDYMYNIIFSVLIIIISLIVKEYLILTLQIIFLPISFIFINFYQTIYSMLLFTSVLYLSLLVFLMFKSFFNGKKSN